jgi:hypothetical protein
MTGPKPVVLPITPSGYNKKQVKWEYFFGRSSPESGAILLSGNLQNNSIFYGESLSPRLFDD